MNKERKKVLAAAWHPGSAQSIVPVIKRLREEDRVDVVVIAYQQYSEDIFRKTGIDYRTIKDYGQSEVSFRAMLCVLDIENNPDLVLTGTSTQDNANRGTIEQSLVEAANSRSGISSLAVVDWWSMFYPRFSDVYVEGSDWCFLPNAVAVIDELALTNALREGFPSDKSDLVITGNPHFDSLAQKASSFLQEDRQRIRQGIGLDCDFLLFFAGNVFQKERENFGYWDLDNISLIVRALEQAGQREAGVVVKLHPRMPESDKTEIGQYLTRFPKSVKIKVVSGIDTHDLILASDVTLVAFSTVGIESVLLGIPCASLQPGLKGENLLPLGEKGFAMPFSRTEEDCLSLLNRIISDVSFRHRMAKDILSFKVDGKATQRVVKLVYDMLGM